MMENNIDLNLSRQHDRCISKIKETYCYITHDGRVGNTAPQKCELPDGKIIHLNEERYECTEALFQPDNKYALQNMLYRSVMKCDVDIQGGCFKNIVLGGGNTMFNGINERLTKEMN
eukprot:196671_1